MRIYSEVGQEAINHEINILFHVVTAPRKGFLHLEEENLKVIDDRLYHGEDDIVAVQDVDVCGGLAQLDACNGGSLSHRLVGAVGLKSLLDGVDKMLLFQVPGAARSSGVCVNDLLQHLRHQDKQHDLQGPDGVAVLVLRLSKVVEEVEKGLATFCQLVILPFL